MSLPRYPKYKESGVEWLGAVPAHWKVMSIKRLSLVRRGASPRPIDDPKYFDDNGDYSWVRIVDVSASNGSLTATTQRMSDLGASLSVRLEPGELFVSIAGTVGKPCISKIKACIHDGFVYFPTLKFAPKFLYRIFEAGTCYAGLGKLGTQLNLNTDIIGSISVPVPPDEEAQRIMDFLERETAKIDALIAEQEKFIALLDEKRQATISHAVTRGLDPNVPMEDSGVEWLGKVPAHWEVYQVRRTLARVEQGWSPECFNRPAQGLEWGVLKTGCVNGGVFNPLENKALPEGIEPDERIEVRHGDLLMSRASGSPALVGSTAFVLEPPPRLMLSDKTFRLHLRTGLFAQFFAIAFGASYFRQQVEQVISGAEGLANNLPQSSLKRLSIIVPPINEQREVVAFVSREAQRLRTLRAECEHAISLLKERRSALITAAVTGQIDVRNAVDLSPEQLEAVTA